MPGQHRIIDTDDGIKPSCGFPNCKDDLPTQDTDAAATTALRKHLKDVHDFTDRA